MTYQDLKYQLNRLFDSVDDMNREVTLEDWETIEELKSFI